MHQPSRMRLMARFDELDEYLRGDSELSQAYRAAGAPQPPAALEPRVLLAAKSRAQKSQCLAPMAFAACVLLSLAIVMALVLKTPVKHPEDPPRITQVRYYHEAPSPREQAAWIAKIVALKRAGRNEEAA